MLRTAIAGMILTAILMATTLYASGASAKPPEARNFNITESPINDLLSQKSVRELLQDSSGFIWIRTQDAIHRYDGYQLQSFHPNQGGLGTLGHGSGRQLLEDQSGFIWISTLGKGPAYYDVFSKEFIAIFTPEETPLEQIQNVSTLYRDSSGYIWLGYQEGSVRRLDPLDKQIDMELDLVDNVGTIVGFAEDLHHNLWVAGARGKIFKCDRPLLVCTVEIDLSRTTPALRISTLTIDPNNRIWVGTESRGAYLLDVAGSISKHFINLEENNAVLTDNSIRRIFVDRKERIWLGTDKGISIYDEIGEFAKFNSTNSELADETILGVLEDTNNNFWIGSYFGLHVGRESPFESFNEKSGLVKTGTTSFSEGSSGEIWVGTYKGLYKINPRTDNLSSVDINTPPKEIEDRRIMSLEQTGGKLWLGYKSRGVDSVRPPTNKVAETPLDPLAVIPSIPASDLEPYNKSHLLVSTFGNGIYLINTENDSVENIANDSADIGPLSSNKIFTSFQTTSGEVLLGTIRGLSVYSPEANKVSILEPHDAESAFISTVQVLSITEDLLGNVWFGTQNAGLILWAHNERKAGRNIFKRIKTLPDLPSSTVYAMETADDGDVWLSTTNGLVRLDVAQQAITIFDRSDGLQDNEFNFGASFKDSQGRLYFGGNKGFNRFNPREVVIDLTPPPLQLTNVHIAGEDLPYDVGYMGFRDLHLSHKHYFLNLEFSVLDYTNSAANHYQYKLENFDSDWIDIGTRHNISFTNLPPGKFHLKVSGANSDGVWNHEGIQIPINVYPPPWFRWWAFSSYWGFLFSIVLLVRKYYDEHKKKEEATKCAASMSHTAERALDDLDEQYHSDQLLLGSVYQHNRSILDIVSNLLELQSDTINDEYILEAFTSNRNRLMCLQSLDKHLCFVAGQIELDFYQFLEELFDSRLEKGFRADLEIVPINDVPDVLVPARVGVLMGMIVYELLDNSLQHAFSESLGVHTIQVSLKSSDNKDAWLLTISDSGCGLPANIDIELPGTTGLEVVKLLCQSLCANLQVSREHGTSYMLEIPKAKANYSRSNA